MKDIQNGSKFDYIYFVLSLTIAFEQINGSKLMIASFYDNFNFFRKISP